MIELCALASGSNGNCYYIGNQHEAILVDAGINTKQILIRMREKGLNPAKIIGIFITHEHSDHVRGVRVLAKKLDIPVYLTKGTYKSLYSIHQPVAYRWVENNQPVQLGSFTVYPILKKHDAMEPTSFRIEYENIHVGVFTDLGEPCENVISHLRQCHALFLETNYDEKMLKDGSYPYSLKARISSTVGHLSNLQAYELLDAHANPQLQCVFLSHLSGENNTPEVAYKELKPLENRFELRLTSRHSPSEIVMVR